tara:strand:+ start:1257 stop:1883 length:627 start_codon:yes stop_codon:yes gene_type:complete
MGLVSGGTTIFDAGAIDSGIATGSMTFIKKLTASSSSTLSFIDGASSVVLDSTYGEYLISFTNIHPATDAQHLQFQVNAVDGSGFDLGVSAWHWRAFNNEGGNDRGAAIHNDPDTFVQNNGTAYQPIATNLGADNDQSSHGFLHLINPSSTTFVTQFYSRFSVSNSGNYIQDNHVCGHFNATAAVDEISFKMTSGAIASGVICLYGIK